MHAFIFFYFHHQIHKNIQNVYGWNSSAKAASSVPKQLRHKRLDSAECLAQINVAGRSKMIAQEIESKCTSLDFTVAASFAFCIPRASKYLIVQKRKECGVYDGYWACDGTGCMRQFIPIPYGQALRGFMKKSVGFYKSVQAEPDTATHHGESRMIFYGDACEMDEKGEHLSCSVDQNEDEDEFERKIIPITQHNSNSFIPYPVIEPDDQCSVN